MILIALLVEQWREKTDWIGIFPLDREPRGGMLLEESCGFSRDFSMWELLQHIFRLRKRSSRDENVTDKERGYSFTPATLSLYPH